MRYRRILLLNPYYPYTRFGAFRPPAGLGYIAEALRRQNIEYDVLDMALGYRRSALMKRVKEFSPDLIAITMMTYMYKNTYSILAGIKDKFPDVKIAAGGPHIATSGEDVLKECEAIDFGIVCEGENAIVELCKNKEINTIKGLLYKEGASIAYNGDRPFTENLDSIPFPTYEEFELNKYMLKEIDLVTSRGCPYGCIYCTVRLASGTNVRMRSASYVADEIEYWHRRGYRNLEIADDNFSFDKDRVHRICEEISKRRLSGLNLRCGNGLRADKVDYDLFKHMKEVGFCHVAFGVESGSATVLKAMKKGESLEILKKAIKTACELDFDVTLFFIIGLPGETESTLQETFRLASKYPVMEAKFFNPIPYPKTELFQWTKSSNLFLIAPEKYLNDFNSFVFKPVYETAEFSADQRKKALKASDWVRKGILRKSIKKKLRKYGPLAYIFAFLYTIPFIERLFREDIKFRRFVDFVTFAREGI
ncbi:MAG: radical SAM protein [Candidatus Omnitrophica bacterium]|nr:radical SAM protein [Candidatus Omnitrophota bacterium]